MTDMLLTTTGPLGQQNPIYYVLETPYIFHQLCAGRTRRLTARPATRCSRGWRRKGLIGLAFWENGFREMSNNARPIKAPADLKGLKMRTQQNRLHMKYFGSWLQSDAVAFYRDLQRAGDQDGRRAGEPAR